MGQVEVTRSMSVPFTHLHTHSPEGSLLDGFMRIEEAIHLAQSWGMDSIGISDHGTMAAYPKFNDLCKKNGIKPVFGMEAYITPNRHYTKADFEGVVYDEDEEGNHIFTLLTDEEVEASSDWTATDALRTKTEQNKMLKEAKEFLRNESWKELEASGLQLADMKKKEQNKYLKEQQKDLLERKHLCVKGDVSRKKFFEWFPRIGHLLLVAKTNEGYHNLVQLCNLGQLDGFYGKPRIDYESIKKYGAGIVATTACLGSNTSQLIKSGHLEEAKEEIERYKEAFDEVYLEIQPSRQPDQWLVNNQLMEWSKEMNLPLIATSDVHMVYHDDLPMHEQLMNINKGHQNEDSSDISVYDSAFFMHPDDMLENGIPPEALENAHNLAMSTDVTALDDNDWKYPVYNLPEGFDSDSYLRYLAEKGLFERYMEDASSVINWDEYVHRLNYELDIIKGKKIAAYFIIVWDFLNECHRRNILTGPGRGSAAGSLVAYSIRITNIDPIRWDLLFERFINPERPGFPDIDSDVDGAKRGEIIDYLAEKYGRNQIAQIGTYIQMKSKSVLKDIGRVHDIDHNEINKVTKLMPNDITLSEAVDEIPEVRGLVDKYPQLLEEGLKAEKLPKTASIHACGVEVSPVDIYSNLPLMPGKNGEVTTEYEGPELEKQGFIKFDILGISTLQQINGAKELAEERNGIKIDLETVDYYSDREIYKLIQKGDTAGLFQLESEGMTGVFTGLKYVDFEAVTAGVAMYR